MKIEFPSENQIPELKELWKCCFFDTDGFINGFFATGFSGEKCRLMRDGGRIAAVLYWLDGAYRGQKLAYLYAVATHPDYRGRGLCRELMADTHDLLRTRGYAAALLLPGEPGLREMYRKMGYRDCCQVEQFSCQAGRCVPTEEIGWETYGTLRPAFLPEDGAVQDGLKFLATYARFYRGQDFILACAREEDQLLGLELLGRKEGAAGILAALNCKTGTFRCPGKGRETAMVLPLAEGVELPRYLGLTFD